MIESLLAYARVESNSLPFDSVDLEDVFEYAVGELAAEIDGLGAEVTRSELPTVRGIRSQLAQLLQNLISNGLKYHHPDRNPAVHVSSTRRDGDWMVRVDDNGVGIEEAYHGRIFELFKRLHAHGEVAGTGIGLSLCRRIVHRHGGEIWVESETGVGSAFQFTLPAHEAGEE